METEIPTIIIGGNKNINDYLGIIFKLGKYNDRIKIKFMDNYINTIESLLTGLRKSFGWLQEDEIKKIEDDNKKCVYFEDDMLNNPGGPSKRGPNYGRCNNKKGEYSKCTFQVRNVCKYYKQKDKTKFLINEVIIQKHGALRGL